jgi:lysozyme
MPLSAKGYEQAKKLEGWRDTAYQCDAKRWTIGWGHTAGVTAGMTCTLEQGELWLRADVAEAEAHVADAITVAVTQAQFDALVLLCLNVGSIKGSHLAALINAGNLAAVPAQWIQWCHYREIDAATGKPGGPWLTNQGLRNRRLAELIVWQSDYDQFTNAKVAHGSVRPAAPSALTSAFQESRTIGGIFTAALGALLSAVDAVGQALMDAVAMVPGGSTLIEFLTSFGLNAHAVGLALAGFGLARAVHARLDAAAQGKIG